jgi:hypothetical protein
MKSPHISSNQVDRAPLVDITPLALQLQALGSSEFHAQLAEQPKPALPKRGFDHTGLSVNDAVLEGSVAVVKRPKLTIGDNGNVNIPNRFCCPFYKKDKNMPHLHISCKGSTWDTVARVK